MTEDDEIFLFSASTTVISHIHKVLKSISLVSGQATLTISAEGLQFSVDDGSHACQAHLFLKNDLFSSYSFRPDIIESGQEDENDGEFVTTRLSLTSLNECLHIFAGSNNNKIITQEFQQLHQSTNNTSSASGSHNNTNSNQEIKSASTCRFIYKGPGSPLIVYLKEGRNLSTRCQLSTFEPMGSGFDELEANSIELEKDKLVQKIILKGETLRDSLSDLDDMKTELITFKSCNNGPPFFQLISSGSMGTSDQAFPNDWSVLETFVVLKEGRNDDDPTEIPDAGDNVVVSNSYQFESIRKCRAALDLANRVSIRCDYNGTMSIQCMCKVSEAEGDARLSFIDFRFRARE